MTRELIEDFTKIVKPFVQKRLLEENFEGMGEQDKAEFGRDFDEILSLAIKGLESSTWIPVTERLPEEEPNTYWVCTNNGCQCECRWTNVNPFWSYETTDWHWNIADIPQYTEVVAWMPLPKPYKGGQEE